MKKRILLLAAALLIPAAATTVKAEIKLPAVVGDNMVLQQQTQAALWGWAKANTTVSVYTSWNNKSYSAKSDAKGKWKIKVQTPAAANVPYTITISDGKSLTLKNILIGEVWICSGQSNMEMAMKGYYEQPIANGPEDILNSANPYLRCFTLTRAARSAPQDNCNGEWQAADPATTPDFTATGYYFARLINRVLNIPVGIIHTSWGGSPIQAWISEEALKDIPEKPVKFPDNEADVRSNMPASLFNGMINPITDYGIRGAIWYQGEANKDEPDLYVKMFNTMVSDWRNRWGTGDFPFYYCQIAPYYYGYGRNGAFIREAQAKGMATTPNTGMAVLMDAESNYCIHPPKKKDAGERMALWALAKTYGRDKIHYRSPEVKSVETNGQVMVISFDLFGSSSGLTTNGKELKGFTVAGENKRFYPAAAVLRNNKVYIFAPEVTAPVAARYLFTDTSAAEIFTIEGNLPISSFRTDEWVE